MSFDPPCVCGHRRSEHVENLSSKQWCKNCPVPREGEHHPYQPDYLSIMQAAFNRKD